MTILIIIIIIIIIILGLNKEEFTRVGLKPTTSGLTCRRFRN